MNPFHYGSIVRGDSFFDRKKERERIAGIVPAMESSINKGINYGIPNGMLFALTAVRQAIDGMPENKLIINTFIY